MAGLLEAASNRKRKQQLESLPSTSKPRVSAGPSATFKEVKALSFASRLIPERTPNRWKLISTLVEDFTHDDVNTDSLQVQLFEKKLSSFSHFAAECKQISDVLCSKYPGTLGRGVGRISDMGGQIILIYISARKIFVPEVTPTN